MISSRVGLKRECITFKPEDNLLEVIANLDEKYYPIEYIYVDECQFLTKEQVIQLWQLSIIDINVMCFGLKTDFKNRYIMIYRRMNKLLSEDESRVIIFSESILESSHESRAYNKLND